MKRKYILIFFLISIFFDLISGMGQSLAQLPFVRFDNIPVTSNSINLDMPWSGGFNNPQFSQIDLNGDGIKDLFVLERNYDGVVKTFINNGTAGMVDYEYAPEYRSKFPPLSHWALLADYNCDGKEDIFTSIPAGIAVYRNDSDPVNGLVFTKVSSLLKTYVGATSYNLYVSAVDIPAIVDVDNDGDLDILTFWTSGSTMEYHQNQSIDNFGNCDSLKFNRVDICWGKFSENTLNNSIALNISCRPSNNLGENMSARKSRHGGSTVLSFDADGDNDKDLLLGDLTFNNLMYIENGGNQNTALMTSYDSLFPSNSVPVNITLFPASFYLDVNNDGLKDLLVAPNNSSISENVNNVWYYENTGTVTSPVFTYVQNDFLQNGMIDVGTAGNPTFVDYDGDGLQDIIVGNYGYFENTGSFISKFSMFKNTGTINSPSFELISDDYAGISSFNLLAMKAAFGDIDGDGDQDMLIGDFEGEIHLFTNTAGAGNPFNFVLTQSNYKSIDIGQNATPQIIDVNRDGKLDLLIGERSGVINYFENTGTFTIPDFSSQPTNPVFGGIDVMIPCCTGYSSPFMTEDSTGNYILYVGSQYDKMYLYDNIDGNLNGAFNLVDSIFLHGLNISISGADINNDNRPEIIYGESAGGIGILTHGIITNIHDNESSQPFDVVLYPNPTRESLRISFLNLRPNKSISCEVYDLLGHRLQSTTVARIDDILDIKTSELADGLYILKVSDSFSILTKRFVVQH